MKKVLVLAGGMIIVLGVFLSMIHPTLGFWEYRVDGTIDIITYLSPFGGFRSSISQYNYRTINEKTSIIIWIVAILGGAICSMTGCFSKNKVISITGSSIALIGLGFFLFSLPQLAEITFLTTNRFPGANVFFGNELDGSDNFVWRLGNGFFITLGGILISFIGSLIDND